MRFIYLLGLSFWISSVIQAQDYSDLRFQNYVYVDNIASVHLFLDGLNYGLPLTDMENNAPLILTFDDVDGDVKDYVYTIIHCDRDWRPSNLQPLEYLDGFEEADVDRPEFSFKSLTDYTHYELVLPNRDMRWKLSGNYLLVVYEDEADKIPVITRRFMVVDRKVGVRAEVSRPAVVSKIQTHQEVDFVVDHERFDIRSPLQEITATVLQNGRWDNALYSVSPKLLRPGQQVLFDHQDVIVFPGGKEFRALDIRSLRRPLSDIGRIEEYNGMYQVALLPEEPRYRTPHLHYLDLNGDFIIESQDQVDGRLSGEYADVFFQLKMNQALFDHDVYIIGAMTDYLPLEKYKLTYNPATNSYVGRILLKQGYYNYYYATLPSGEIPEYYPAFNLEETEGNSAETENMYTILIYYRAFANRYDQLIGAYQISSAE